MTSVHDDFASITESAPLVSELRDRIRREGPITFRDFMWAALYHPDHGYYTSRPSPTGRGGDFLTSPEVHPIFGVLVAKQLAQMWNIMSRPPRFDVVEQGAGTGALARDIMMWSTRHEPEFAAALRYLIVEPRPRLQREQHRTLEDAGLADERVAWSAAFPPAIAGCLISNELLDSFPVHRVVRQGENLNEVFVGLDAAGRFVDELRPLADARLRQYFDDLGVLPGDGCYAEVNLQAIDWMRQAAASLERGYVLTFDYGYEAPDLYASWRRDGTLLCSYRQSASSDPYQRIGKQDMTSSIDFTTLRRTGEDAGLRTIGLTSQSDFLIRMGIGDAIAAVAAPGSEQMEEYFARRRVVMDLIDPARLGRVTVLAQSKRMPDAPLRGFVDA